MFSNMVCMSRPDLIEYNKLTKVNPLQNLNNAFNVADQKLGLTPLLDAEGELDCIICDRRLCFRSHLFHNSDEVMAWLSVWSEVQIICIWSS